jgi:RNA polymerase sigma-70 factor, ECF subfamily
MVVDAPGVAKYMSRPEVEIEREIAERRRAADNRERLSAEAETASDSQGGMTSAHRPDTARNERSGMDGTNEFRGQVVECLPQLRAFARVLTRNKERADDLVHDTLVRALAAEDKFQKGTNIKAWLLTILRNQHISDLRRRKVEVEPVDDLVDAALPTPPGQFSAVEFSELRKALMKMSVQHREVLILVAAAGLSYEDTAEVCKCAVGTVKSRLNRARVELRRLLSEQPAQNKSEDELTAAEVK